MSQPNATSRDMFYREKFCRRCAVREAHSGLPLRLKWW